MAAFKFNLQQIDLTGAYDRYLKELEDQKKQELYDNKLVEQEVDDFAKYYNPNSVRDNDKPVLYSTFKTYETAAKNLNKARRLGNVDEINRYREQMQKAISDMGDIYNNAVTAKGVAAEFQKLYNMQKDGKVVIDSKTFEDDWNLFTNGSLGSIKEKYGSSDKWGNAVTGLEYTNNKFNESLGKTITAFNSNKNNYITGTAPVEYQTQKLTTGDDFKIPVFEKTPDYNKALQLAMVQPEAMKKKIFQQFNTELAQGGTISDIARVKQSKIATIFGKTPDQLTADDLLAYSIAGDARKEADFKQGKAAWEMAMDERKFAYKKELDDKKMEIAKEKAANKGKDKVTNMELVLLTNYYKESKGGFKNPGEGLIDPKKFQSFLDGVDPKIIGFIHKAAPKTKTDLNQMYKVLEGYMKNPSSFIAAVNVGN